MFNPFKKSQLKGTQLKLKLSGLHCTSCSLNIDGELEDLPGVYSSSTSYAKSTTIIDFNPAQVTPSQIRSTITKLGYTVDI